MHASKFHRFDMRLDKHGRSTLGLSEWNDWLGTITVSNVSSEKELKQARSQPCSANSIVTINSCDNCSRIFDTLEVPFAFLIHQNHDRVGRSHIILQKLIVLRQPRSCWLFKTLSHNSIDPQNEIHRWNVVHHLTTHQVDRREGTWLHHKSGNVRHFLSTVCMISRRRPTILTVAYTIVTLDSGDHCVILFTHIRAHEYGYGWIWDHWRSHPSVRVLVNTLDHLGIMLTGCGSHATFPYLRHVPK